MNIYKITLLALLAALAIVGRVSFAFLPNVQPVTAVIIICGLILGPLSAALLAILTTFLSNMILGTGIWTLWQIISWIIIGLLSGLLGKIPKKIPVILLAVFGVFSGYFYGLIVSLTNYQITGQNFYVYYLAGLPFDTYHAIGNAIFILVMYPIIYHFLKKYAKERFELQR
ncbi:ECF transporter S component [Ornithinibacillus halophilus]|uniref:Energy-coupling factor transport system substrate-specific component n=1 Tax=Ornithinibacillus halophilus TaxID=930117 RepID=A0A1M5CSH5_9BACI|nr:ECF transporter S component [Ornithinibacillus halophilus]SHF57691.1 energy-coupling factor transport system substrate-specific component [Ornithinibacillus halophilus]